MSIRVTNIYTTIFTIYESFPIGNLAQLTDVNLSYILITCNCYIDICRLYNINNCIYRHNPGCLISEATTETIYLGIYICS